MKKQHDEQMGHGFSRLSRPIFNDNDKARRNEENSSQAICL